MRKFYFLVLAAVLMLCCNVSVEAQKVGKSWTFDANGPSSEDWIVGKWWKFTDAGALFYARIMNGADTLVSPIFDYSNILDNEPSVALRFRNVPYETAKNTRLNRIKVLCRPKANSLWEEVKETTIASEDTTIKFALPPAYDGNYHQVQLAIAVEYYGGVSTSISQVSVENADMRKPEKVTIFPAHNGLHFRFQAQAGADHFNYKVSSRAINPDTEEADIISDGIKVFSGEKYDDTKFKANTTYHFYLQGDFGENYGKTKWFDTIFTTEGAISKFPYTVDFEGELDTMIRIIRSGTSATNDVVSTSQHHGGEKAFYFNEGQGKYSRIILPAIEGDIHDYQISFWVYRDADVASSEAVFSVYVGSDSALVYKIQRMDLKIPQTKKGLWQKCEIQFNTGQIFKGSRIVIEAGTANKANSFYIDDIEIKKNSGSSPMPIFAEAYNITSNGATFNWLEGGTETEYNMIISPTKINPRNLDNYEGRFTINQLPYTTSIPGASPMTKYYFYVQPSGSLLWTEVDSFKTERTFACPFEETFSSSIFPEYWVAGARNITDGSDEISTSTSNIPTRQSGSNYNHNATSGSEGSLTMSASLGTVPYVILPEIECSKNFASKAISLWAKRYSANFDIDVLIGFANTKSVDMPSNEQFNKNITFTDTFRLLANTNWQEVIIPLAKYKEEYGKYIVISMREKGSTSNQTCYFDDIEINDATDCYKVRSLTAMANTTKSIKLHWTEANTATKWHVRVSSSKDFLSTSETPADVFDDIVTTTEQVISKDDLEAGTELKVFVSPVCGEDETGRIWDSTITTTAATLSLPYFNDFENEPTGSSVIPKALKGWTIGNSLYVSTAATVPYVNNSAPTTIPTNNYSTNRDIMPRLASRTLTLASTTRTVTDEVTKIKETIVVEYMPYVITPAIENAAMKDVRMTFYLTANAETENQAMVLKVGVVDNVSEGIENVTLVKKIELGALGVTELINVDFSSYQGSGKYIVFYNDTEAVNNVCIDNLAIGTKTNRQWKPINIRATEKSNRSIKLAWTEYGDANEWQVRVFERLIGTQEYLDSAWYHLQDIEVSGSSSTEIKNLQGAQLYYIYVRNKKDGEYGPWSDVCRVITDCRGTLPFKQGFDAEYNFFNNNSGAYHNFSVGGDNILNYLVSCYDMVKALGPESIVVGAASIDTMTAPDCKTKPNAKGLRLKPGSTEGAESQFVLPLMEKPVNQLQLSVAVRAEGNGYIGSKSKTYFGVVTDDGVFHEVTTRQTTAFYGPGEIWHIDFSSYSGADGRIAFKVGANADMYFDNILVEEITPCKFVQDLKITGIGLTTASVSWKKENNISSWDVAYSTKATNNPDALDARQVTNVTTNTCDLTNLTAGTTYYVYVRAKTTTCSSNWSEPLVLTTSCEPTSVPFVWDFNSDGVDNASDAKKMDIPCTYRIGDLTTGDAAWISQQSDAFKKINATRTLGLSQVQKEYNNYFVFPLVECESVNDLKISMRVYSSTSKGNIYYYEIGSMEDPYDLTTWSLLQLDSVKNEEAAITERTVTYSFKKATSVPNNKYIAIHVVNSVSSSGSLSAGTIYIDDVTIEKAGDVEMPSDVAIKEIGTDSAVLIWKNNGGEKFLIKCVAKPNAVDTDEGIEGAIETNDFDVAYTLRNLQPATTYTVFVRAQYKGSFSDWTLGQTFRTACAEVEELPYKQGFDDLREGDNSCWTDYKTLPDLLKASDMAACTTYVSSDLARSGGGCVYLRRQMEQGSSSNTNPAETSQFNAKIISPRLDIDKLENVIMYFSAKDATGTALLQIFAMEELSAEAKRVHIADIPIEGKTYHTYCVNFADYGPFAVHYPYICLGSLKQSVYLDDIEFTTADDKRVLPVEDLKVEAITTNSITISFREAMPWTTSWRVYCVSGDVAPSGQGTLITSTTYTITGLTPNTAYNIYVYDGNSYFNSENEPSLLNVKTIETASNTVPYETGFEDEEDNATWTIVSKDKDGVTVNNYFVIGDGSICGGTGNKAVYITNDGSAYKYTLTQGAKSFMYRPMHLETGYYNFIVKVKNEGDRVNKTNDKFHIVLLPVGTQLVGNASPTLVNGKAASFSSTNESDHVYAAVNNIYDKAEWTRVDTNVFVESGDYLLTLVWDEGVLTTGTVGNPAAVDSIIVKASADGACINPTNIRLTQATSNSLAFNWRGGSNVTYEWYLMTEDGLRDPSASVNASMVIKSGVVQGLNTTIDDLTVDSGYFYVKAQCEKTWTRFGAIVRRPCDATGIPYEQDFAEFEGKNFDGCFTFVGGASVMTESFDIDGLQERTKCVSLSENAMLIFPQFSRSLKDLYVEIGVGIKTLTGMLELGVVDDINDVSSFKPLQAYYLSQVVSYNEAVIIECKGLSLSDYEGEGYLAVRNPYYDGKNKHDVYLKSVRVIVASCPSVAAFTVAEADQAWATLKWVAGEETAWQLQLRKQIGINEFEDDQIDLHKDVVTQENKETSFTLTNLEPGFTYYVQIRPRCSDNDFGEWSPMVKFNTGCPVREMPYNEDFANLVIVNNRKFDLNCWETRFSNTRFGNVFDANEIVDGVTDLHKATGKENTNKLWRTNTSYRVMNTVGKEDDKQIVSEAFFESLSSEILYKWLIGPTIDLTVDGTNSVWFTCQARYCENNGNKVPCGGDRFFVIISADGGATWKAEDATEFKLGTDITSDPTMSIIAVDLTKYKGQSIKFAFYHESVVRTKNWKGDEIHPSAYLVIDDIRINTAVSSKNEDNACEETTYKRNRFNIPADQLPALGETKTFTRVVRFFGDEQKEDTVDVVTLTTQPNHTEFRLSEKVCDQPFALGENDAISFDYASVDENTPFVAYLDNAAGCDSIVYINLTLPDTVDLSFTVDLGELPKRIDEYLTITADMNLVAGDTAIIVPRGGDRCSDVNRYTLTIQTGLDFVFGDIVQVEVYDCLGRLMGTFDQTTKTEMNFPVGVYLLRYRYFDGRTKTESYVIK